jgi:hypothetical protein
VPLPELRVDDSSHGAMSANVDKAVAAIKALAEHKGSSRQALVKYFKIELNIDNAQAVAKALKGGCGRLLGAATAQSAVHR